MTNVRRFNLPLILLCAGTLLYGQAVWADTKPCTPVAKLVLPEGKRAASIKVERDTQSGRAPLLPITELCKGDKVNWPAGVTVGILYYVNPPKYSETPGPNQIRIIKIPENTWVDNILVAAKRWLLTDSVVPVRIGATRGLRPITSPLARGEYNEIPFYLITDITTVNFFWRGGQAPWKLQIIDSSERVVVDESVSVREATFNLPEQTDETGYILKVSSADGRTLQKRLVLESPMRHQINELTDPWTKILRLLAQDDEKNWRLYIWNSIRGLPDGPAKASIMRHLEEDDI